MPDKPKPEYDLLVITGPTASGKTSLAVTIAYSIGGEIISADSRQVYRGMNIGTGKDYNEYVYRDSRVPYHLIDLADPGYKYNVFEYQRDFRKVYDDLRGRDVFPVVCGGSGMYIDSIISGYRMNEVPPDSGLRACLEKKSMEELTDILSSYRKLHNTTDIDTKKRVIRAIEIEYFNRFGKQKQTSFPVINSLIVGIMAERNVRRKRISERLKQRLDTGMVDEVRDLLDSGIGEVTLTYYGLEYKFITAYLTGKTGYDEMVEQLETAIHQFAKRQMTWFRGMERRGIKINWIDSELPMEEKVGIVMRLISDTYPAS